MRLPVAVDPVKPILATYRVRGQMRPEVVGIDHVDHAGNTCAQTSQQERAGRRGRRGLEHDGIARERRWADLPQRHQQGKFHAMMPTTTPSGRCLTTICPAASSWITRSSRPSVA
jgi:hypothetical protein